MFSALKRPHLGRGLEVGALVPSKGAAEGSSVGTSTSNFLHAMNAISWKLRIKQIAVDTYPLTSLSETFLSVGALLVETRWTPSVAPLGGVAPRFAYQMNHEMSENGSPFD